MRTLPHSAVIFDLDGTLADLTHRRHHVDPNYHPDAPRSFRPNWDAFHKGCVEDLPLLNTIAVLKRMHGAWSQGFYERAHQIWIVSGRSESVRRETETWLSNHRISYDHLVMRPVGDYTPDDQLKELWLLGGKIPAKEAILCVFDDRDRVVKMWRSHGLTCFQVAPGAF